MVSLSFLAILYNLSRRRLCRFLLLCFPVTLLISGELPPSNQRLCRRSVALNSSACSLRTQPTCFCCLTSPENCSARSSSSWPATSPSQALRRGQISTVRLCPYRVLLQLRHYAVVLYDPLISHFDHHNHRSIATDDGLLRRACSERRPASSLLLRPCSFLSRVRGEVLNPFVLSV